MKSLVMMYRVGSLKKEVRDDIPAQLSEGVLIFMPADVVRFHGS